MDHDNINHLIHTDMSSLDYRLKAIGDIIEFAKTKEAAEPGEGVKALKELLREHPAALTGAIEAVMNPNKDYEVKSEHPVPTVRVDGSENRKTIASVRSEVLYKIEIAANINTDDWPAQYRAFLDQRKLVARKILQEKGENFSNLICLFEMHNDQLKKLLGI